MTTFVLIIMVFGGGMSPAVTTQEFNSSHSCREALAVLESISPGRGYLRLTCVSKD